MQNIYRILDNINKIGNTLDKITEPARKMQQIQEQLQEQLGITKLAKCYKGLGIDKLAEIQNKLNSFYLHTYNKPAPKELKPIPIKLVETSKPKDIKKSRKKRLEIKCYTKEKYIKISGNLFKIREKLNSVIIDIYMGNDLSVYGKNLKSYVSLINKETRETFGVELIKYNKYYKRFANSKYSIDEDIFICK